MVPIVLGYTTDGDTEAHYKLRHNIVSFLARYANGIHDFPGNEEVELTTLLR